MRATEFLNYIKKKKKPSKNETDENYTHFACNEYEKVTVNGKKVKRLTKQSQKYEDIRKKINKKENR
jgi:alanine racemase